MKKILGLLFVFIFLTGVFRSKAQLVRREFFDENGHPHDTLIVAPKIKRNIFREIFPPPNTFTTVTLVDNGAGKINLVFMGDGYTAGQQTQFLTDVMSIWNTMITTYPYSIRQTSFNVIAIEVISNQSLCHHPNTAVDCSTANPLVPTMSPDTYLGVTFDYGGIHRLMYPVNESIATGVLLANYPTYTQGLIVVNTPLYYGGGGGTYAVASSYTGSTDIMIHELGHSLWGLGDEYGGVSCGGIELPNVTQQNNPALLKWKDLLTPGIPIPTSNGTNCGFNQFPPPVYPNMYNVGLYQGANYCNTGWYRPSCNCKMNNLGQPFCAVCAKTGLAYIDNFVPPANPCPVPTSVTATNITATSATISWATATGAVSYTELTGTTTNTVGLFVSLTGLTPSTTYHYQVKTICNTAESAYSNDQTFNTIALPTPIVITPTVVNALCTTGSISIGVSGGTSPYTYKWTTGATTQNLTGLVATGTYTVTVTDHVGATASSTNSVTLQTVTVPTSVHSTTITTTSIKMVWTPTGCSTKYQARYRIHGTTTYGSLIAAGSGTSKTITGLTRNTSYDIQIRAVTPLAGVNHYSAWVTTSNITTLP